MPVLVAGILAAVVGQIDWDARSRGGPDRSRT
jgi:hypothetical protein